MKKFIYSFLLVASFLITSCGPSEMIIPEGTDPEVAAVMKKTRLSKDNAITLIDALANQSGLAGFTVDDIASVYQTSIAGRRVLAVNVSGRNTMYVNLD